MICQGLGCNCTKLIKAHIVPRCFARALMGQSTHNIQVSLVNARPTQHGVYDPTILCAKCDGILGEYDDYAIEICKRFEPDHIVKDETFELANVDGDKFAKFALALLWRASISSRPEFKKINLGPYERAARDVLFGAKPLSDIRGYELMLFRFKKIANFDVPGFYSSPSRLGNLGVNGWKFALSGFKFVAKMDQRPWPDIPAEIRDAIVVNGNSDLRGSFVDFRGSSEHRAALAMAGAQLARNRRKSK